jgi:hypothetical protein
MNACKLHGPALLSLLTLSVVACSKSESPSPTAVAVPSEAPTISITATPPAPAAASAPASASARVAAPAKASPSTSTTTSASTITTPTSATKEPSPLKPAAARITGKNFTLDAASPGCRVETPCTVTLRLAAAGEYHVNKEYPYKFLATAAPGVQFLGSGDANTFSRAAGDFREEGEKSATMTVRFKPTATGEARVTGTYKMSVCSAENCQIETPTVTLAVPVM